LKIFGLSVEEEIYANKRGSNWFAGPVHVLEHDFIYFAEMKIDVPCT